MALPSGVLTPPTPSRFFFKRLCSRSGLLGRSARGCLGLGGSVAGGAGASGVPEGGTSVDRASLDGGAGSFDSVSATGVPGASGSAASMG